MNWQKISVERLREYTAQKDAELSLAEQIETLELAFEAVRSASFDATAVRGGGNKREDALIKNIVMREELQRNLEIVKREIETTEKGLKALSKEQRRILEKFFVSRNYRHVEDLSEELNLEKSRIYTLKDEALRKFTISCYGVVDL